MKVGLACPYSWDMPPALPGQSSWSRPEPELDDLCSTRRQSQIAASRKYSAICSRYVGAPLTNPITICDSYDTFPTTVSGQFLMAPRSDQ